MVKKSFANRFRHQKEMLKRVQHDDNGLVLGLSYLHKEDDCEMLNKIRRVTNVRNTLAF